MMSIDVLSVVLGFVAGLAVLGAFVAYRSRSQPGHGTSSETLGTPTVGSTDDVANGAYCAELARTVPDMVVVIGPDRVRRYISPACEWLLGYPPEEMIGQSPINGIHPDDRATTMEASERLFKGEVSVALTTYRHRHADGHYVWLEAHFATRWNEDGELRDYIGVVRDIGG
ncbi:MAG: PAS domain-containing protein, partial [Pseudomonadota bacterium]|nr:PAS domain-containing protein [Pseudomonadota bacterium]